MYWRNMHSKKLHFQTLNSRISSLKKNNVSRWTNLEPQPTRHGAQETPDTGRFVFCSSLASRALRCWRTAQPVTLSAGYESFWGKRVRKSREQKKLTKFFFSFFLKCKKLSLERSNFLLPAATSQLVHQAEERGARWFYTATHRCSPLRGRALTGDGKMMMMMMMMMMMTRPSVGKTHPPHFAFRKQRGATRQEQTWRCEDEWASEGRGQFRWGGEMTRRG